ncbi:hypothetical protein [Sporosarcina sp. YIM B06819]|uniref:hypothetical protein n=1 Tax=Sporosarcina sp. YIM B06819 TaxID=3081769 RepID=UPI00298C9A3F|nr:hypothetical protein [Sporosarcina sp. YIM B06819]
MMGWLNVGSLVLGLIAWILPVVSLMRYIQGGHKNWAAFSVMSVSACAISLYFQIVYNHHLVTIGDWSALMDTTGALVKVGAVLLIVTIVLNTATLVMYRDRKVK